MRTALTLLMYIVWSGCFEVGDTLFSDLVRHTAYSQSRVKSWPWDKLAPFHTHIVNPSPGLYNLHFTSTSPGLNVWYVLLERRQCWVQMLRWKHGVLKVVKSCHSRFNFFPRLLSCFFFSPLFSKVFLGNFVIIKVGLKLQKVKKLCTEVSCVACMWMNLFCCVLAFVQEYRYIMCKCTWRGLWGGRQWVGTSPPPAKDRVRGVPPQIPTYK